MRHKSPPAVFDEERVVGSIMRRACPVMRDVEIASALAWKGSKSKVFGGFSVAPNTRGGASGALKKAKFCCGDDVGAVDTLAGIDEPTREEPAAGEGSRGPVATEVAISYRAARDKGHGDTYLRTHEHIFA